MDNLPGALDYFTTSLKEAQNIYRDVTHFDFLDYYSNLGIINEKINEKKLDFVIADQYFQNSLKIANKIGDDNKNPKIAICYSNLGRIAIKQENFQEAFKNFLKVQNIISKFYPDEIFPDFVQCN